MADLDFLHGGNIYELKGKDRKKIIDFSANINPLGLPAGLKEAIYKNFDRILHYPDYKATDITKKIAKCWGIDEENVLLGNGSVELIYLIISFLRPKTAFVPVPTFSEYERAARGIKSRIEFLKLKEKEGFKLDLSSIGKTDILFLCNPNNPTGNLIAEDGKRIEALSNKLVVVDEAFMDFLPEQKNYTLIWKAVKSKKLIVLRTLTKFFALPGLRVGYLIAHKKIIDKLRQYQAPWGTNSLAQLAAGLILNDKVYIKKTRKLIGKERKYLSKQLAAIVGLKPYPSVANFLLLKIERPGLSSKSLQRLLLEKGILIRDCANFRNLNDKYIRVAVRSHKENLQLLAALKEVL